MAELKELTVTYAKQETIEPLKGLGRQLLWGVAGSVLLSVGLVLLTLGLLRGMQTETGTALSGNWSWVPYVVSIVFLAVLIGWALSKIRAKGTPR